MAIVIAHESTIERDAPIEPVRRPESLDHLLSPIPFPAVRAEGLAGVRRWT